MPWRQIDLTNAHSSSVQELIGWLEDRELRLQLAIEAADLGIWNWDPSTDGVVWSDKCRQLLDLSPDSPASMKQVWQQIHPDDRDAVRQAIATSLSSLGNYSIEHRIVLRDGGIRWLHCLGRSHRVKPGAETIGMSGVLRDVTPLRRAEEASLRQKQYLQQLLQMAPIGVAKFDRQMRFIDTNRRFVDGLRLGSQPLVGRSLYHVLPEIPLHWREAHKCCLNGKLRRLDREAFLRADGSIDWTEGQLLPWYDGRSNIGGVVWIVEVVTPHRRDEDLERVATAVFLNHPDPIAIADPSRLTFQFVNHAYARLLGRERNDLEGLPILSCYDPAELPRLIELGRLADSNGHACMDLALLHRDGWRIPVRVTLHSIRGDDNQPMYRVATIADRRDDLQRSAVDANEVAALSSARAIGATPGGRPPRLGTITGAENGFPPFPDALAQLVGDHAQAASLEFELDLPEVIGHAAPAVLRTLLDVAREALLNTVRHARATRLAVVLRVDKALITLRIWDDGIGIRDADRRKPECSGLQTAAERLASVGGTLQVSSTPGKGSTFDAAVPLTPAHRP